MFCACEIIDGNDYIIEGYHVTPQLVDRLMTQYGNKNFRTIFIVRDDVEAFVNDCKKSSTPHDWILRKTKNQETFYKIGEMIQAYSAFFSNEAKKYGFSVVNMNDHFSKQLDKALNLLIE